MLLSVHEYPLEILRTLCDYPARFILQKFHEGEAAPGTDIEPKYL
jgi:hypothetical protein